MPVYETRRTADAYGYSVGILLLDTREPFVPGDVGNATTYDFPVLYRTVPGAHPSRVFVTDPELNEPVVEAARWLEGQGVKGISSDCGFYLNYQDVVREAVDVPVFMSSLLQLPFISAMLGRDRSIGVVTASSTALSNRVLELSGIEAERPVIVRGMQDVETWVNTFADEETGIDPAEIEAEVVKVATEIAEENPDMGAIVLECSLMPPYGKAVQEATGLPVFDFINLINYHQRAAHRKAYDGYY